MIIIWIILFHPKEGTLCSLVVREVMILVGVEDEVGGEEEAVLVVAVEEIQIYSHIIPRMNTQTIKIWEQIIIWIWEEESPMTLMEEIARINLVDPYHKVAVVVLVEGVHPHMDKVTDPFLEEEEVIDLLGWQGDEVGTEDKVVVLAEDSTILDTLIDLVVVLDMDLAAPVAEEGWGWTWVWVMLVREEVSFQEQKIMILVHFLGLVLPTFIQGNPQMTWLMLKTMANRIHKTLIWMPSPTEIQVVHIQQLHQNAILHHHLKEKRR
jgi:hypothetical protein